MDNKTYRFDIAFSYDSFDFNFVNQVYQELTKTSNLKIFEYTKYLSEIHGKDGGEYYYDIFNSQSKKVVIFYRQGWSKLGMTIYENRGIRDRELIEGDSFYIMHPMYGNFPLPTGYSKLKIYINNPEAEVKIASEEILKWYGNPDYIKKNESVVDKIINFENDKRTLGERYKELYSTNSDGVKYANKTYEDLIFDFEKKIKQINNDVVIQYKDDYYNMLQKTFYAIYKNIKVQFIWNQEVLNSLTEAKLHFFIQKRANAKSPFWTNYENVHYETFKFIFNPKKSGNENFGWIQEKISRIFYSNEELIELTLQKILELLKNSK